MVDQEDGGPQALKHKNLQPDEVSIQQNGTPTLSTIVVVRDGRTLHPQPTTDPLDPLNWPSMRKNTILAIVMAMFVNTRLLGDLKNFII